MKYVAIETCCYWLVKRIFFVHWLISHVGTSLIILINA